MIIAGHQPHYLPWIGYFSKILQCDRFCLVDTVQYNKKWFQNRTRIRSGKGEILLTVPVKTSGKFEQPISDVEIDNATPWRRKHWRSIALTYKSAPHFDRYAGFLENAYARDWTLLADLNEHLLLGLLDFLGIEKQVVRSSTFRPEGQKTDLLIDICRKTGSAGYLSGTGGAKSYVDESKFERAGLVHRFQTFTHPVYPQLHGGFVPRMSVVDLLFNCGPESGDIVRRASEASATTGAEPAAALPEDGGLDDDDAAGEPVGS